MTASRQIECGPLSGREVALADKDAPLWEVKSELLGRPAPQAKGQKALNVYKDAALRTIQAELFEGTSDAADVVSSRLRACLDAHRKGSSHLPRDVTKWARCRVDELLTAVLVAKGLLALRAANPTSAFDLEKPKTSDSHWWEALEGRLRAGNLGDLHGQLAGVKALNGVSPVVAARLLACVTTPEATRVKAELASPGLRYSVTDKQVSKYLNDELDIHLYWEGVPRVPGKPRGKHKAKQP